MDSQAGVFICTKRSSGDVEISDVMLNILESVRPFSQHDGLIIYAPGPEGQMGPYFAEIVDVIG